MPPIRSLFTVDAEGFSRDRDLPEPHTEIVETAAERGGPGEPSRAARLTQSTGGVLAAPLLDAWIRRVSPLPGTSPGVRTDALPRASRPRLRLSVGLEDDAVTAAVSKATSTVCRPPDGGPARPALSGDVRQGRS